MDDLLQQMDDNNSDTSIIDFDLVSDDEEIINDNVQPNQESQDQEEIPIQEEQVVEEKAQTVQIEQNYFELNYIQKQEEDNVISLPNKLKPKLIKRKQPRECNLLQGYQLLKSFGNQSLISYRTIQQKKDQALMKMTNFIISGVQKMKRL
ncbi:unnamed protein product [Paramecium sonneborni]|uniref:Uncharacterized protein n=1 Tax=Paramecium sonneborni TaxID=65129 RepID=A0A8S1KXN1_9CILI|nr:unnamed protein product [Paramecium sonneborni]